jgi:UDP-N-acetylmuramate--alanine ligase
MVYLVGIKGVGMTALAQVLQAKGIQVMGSDSDEVFMTDAVLAASHITVKSPFHIANIPVDIEYAVVSGAYYIEGKEPTNPEVIELLARNIPIFTYSQALGNIAKQFDYTIAVAGSHGKTTTSALLTFGLQELQQNPFGVIGSVVPQFGGNARIGDENSQYLVVEADEYQNHFLDLDINTLIILNIDYDHPDFFANPDIYYQAFIHVINQLSPDKTLIINGDDEIISEYILPSINHPEKNIIRFGLKEGNNIRLDTENRVIIQGNTYSQLTLSIAGEHNRLNALSCIALLYSRGFDINESIQSLANFHGTQRRLEYKRITEKGVIIIDDYAHHPTEIKAGLQALREKYSHHSIHCVFQPHTFSRTQVLLQEFGEALAQADSIYLLPIYASAREQAGTVTSSDILPFIQNTNTTIYETESALISDLEQIQGPDSIIVTMGAGDVWKITQNMV